MKSRVISKQKPTRTATAYCRLSKLIATSSRLAIAVGPSYCWPVRPSVRCPSRGHILKTKQDRPIVTITKLASPILLPHSDPPQTSPRLRDIDSTSTSAQQTVGLGWHAGRASFFLSQWRYSCLLLPRPGDSRWGVVLVACVCNNIFRKTVSAVVVYNFHNRRSLWLCDHAVGARRG